jgi:glycerate dehydrogenase
MKKIVVLGPTPTDNQKKRLETLGTVTYLPGPSSAEELIKQSEGADILLSEKPFLFESLPKLKNIFVAFPFVELGEFNTDELKVNKVFLANAQGGNRASIIEWVMFMTISLFRKFTPLVRATEDQPFALQESLEGKKVLIIGKGNIGTKIAIPCEAFGMIVTFYERGDDLLAKSKDVDVVINALNTNSSSKNLLNEEFFMSLKRGTYFVSFVRQHTYDLHALIKSINAGIVGGAAIDCDPEKFGDTTNDFYKTCLSNEKILVTPHVAFSTKQAMANGIEIAVQNIEAFVAGKPQNILKKN